MASKVKNIVFAGEPQAGKTQLCEAIFYKTGVSTRLNLVDKGQSILDSQKDERERKLTIDIGLGYFDKGDLRVNIIDTPGYADFIGEVLAGVFASDFVFIVVDASSQITYTSKRIFDIAQKYSKPVAFFINGASKDAANITQRLEEIKKITINAAPFYIAEKDSGKDVLESEGMEEYREALIEAVASSDDTLLEKYLNEGTLSKEEIKQPLLKGIEDAKIVPVLSGDAISGVGVDFLISFIEDFVPEKQYQKDGEFIGQVFKISSQGHIGEVAYTKIIQGKITSGSDIYNVSRSVSMRASQILKIIGADKKQESQAQAGDIVGFVKLKEVWAGDTLSTSKNTKPLPFVEFPEPVYSVAVRPKTRGEEEKVATSLASLRKENPIITFGFNPETKQMLLSGMGKVQLDILARRIIDNFNTEIVLSPPKIPYKETFTVPADAEGKYKRQTGGHGQYGHCFIKFEPLERGAGFEFVDQIVGGAIPSNYIPAVEKGLKNAMEKGVIAGYPVVDIKATLYDGTYHEVDSSNLAFEIAASMCLRNAAEKASPIVLEPIYELEIFVPDEFTGTITGDITARRGRIVSFEKEGDLQKIKALVPLAEILEYVNDLRSMTKGQGEFKRKFSHYEPAPHNIMQALVDQYQKQLAEGKVER